jgi:hypothetical protein
MTHESRGVHLHFFLPLINSLRK